MQPGEIAKRLAALAKLKIHPRDDMKTRALVARAARLYEERLGDTRAESAKRSAFDGGHRTPGARGDRSGQQRPVRSARPIRPGLPPVTRETSIDQKCVGRNKRSALRC